VTKKHFIELARTLKREGINNDNALFTRDSILNVLADFCQAQNPRFDRALWLRYVKDECGPGGGELKKGASRGKK